MTITYNLAPDPFWTINDLTGAPLRGGFIYTFSSINPTIQKTVFQDPNGAIAWTNPILVPINGQIGPIYWASDSSNTADNYYVVVTDSNGNTVWEIDNFNGTVGGGGGGGGTTYVNQNNLVINNVFWRNNGIGSNPATISNPTSGTVLAPSAHAGFVTPDCIFGRAGSGSTDSINFVPIAVGQTPFSPLDNTPELYLNYTCTVGGSETLKFIQFPIQNHLKTLEKQQVQVSIWLQAGNPASVGQKVSLFWDLFGGTGGGATTTQVLIGSAITLTANWTQYSFNVNVPAANLVTIGTNNNDGLYLWISLPVGAGVVTNINIAKPSIFVGPVLPNPTFQSYDQIDSVISAARTGDLKYTMNSTNQGGWLQMNDTTIGSVGSGATFANNASYYLYTMIWNLTNTNATTQAWAPVTGGRGGSADADFTANKKMQLLYSLGATLANVGTVNTAASAYGPNQTGTNWPIAQPNGEELHPLIVAELAAHSHQPVPASNHNFIVEATDGSGSLNSTLTLGTNAIQNNSTSTVGSGTGHNTIQPTLRAYLFIKL